MFKTFSNDKRSVFGSGTPAHAIRKSKGAAAVTAGNIRRSKNSERDFINKVVTAQSDFGLDRYNPVHDDLEEGSVVENWVPKDLPSLNRLMRRIYRRDDVGGPMVDIYQEMAWSDYDLTGMEDEAMYEPYAQSLANLNPMDWMPDISNTVLVDGRGIYGLLFDEAEGVFTGSVPHDSSFCRITPVPIFGQDPLVDIQASPVWRNFATSNDPRMAEMRSSLPPNILKVLRDNTGYTPLDPLSTVIVRRQASAHDHLGTSIYTRLINFIAIQKALIDTTVIALRRRGAGLLHIQVGNEVWEPTDDQLDAIAAMWMGAEEDPGGGVVVTRNGIQADRSQSAVGDIWKFSDEYPFLSEGKMRSLGISDAFLSGDATYNNMANALSVFMERLRGFRMRITNKVLVQRVFHTLARVHGYIKPEKNSPQGRRQAFLMPLRQALEVPADRLIVPDIHWHKSLQPQGDEELIRLLETLKENGLPVTKQHFAAAAGFNLNKAMDMLEDDIKQEEEVRKWRAEIEGGDEEGIFGRVRLVPHTIQQIKKPRELRVAASKALEDLGFFRNGPFLGLSLQRAQRALDRMLPDLKRDGERAPLRTIMADVDLEREQRNVMRYLLVRLGFAPSYQMNDQRLERVARAIAQALPAREAHQEIELLVKVCGGKKEHYAERVTRLPNGPSGAHLLTGYVPPGM